MAKQKKDLDLNGIKDLNDKIGEANIEVNGIYVSVNNIQGSITAGEIEIDQNSSEIKVKADEQILYVDRNIIFQDGEEFEGVIPVDKELKNRLGNNVQVAWRYEDKLEEDTTKKQLIPYTPILNRDENKVFVYERKNTSGEGRLYGKWSIGVGGHANMEEHVDFDDLINKNLQRELYEEVNIGNYVIDGNKEGFLNAKESEVDEVHFGIVKVLVSTDDKVFIEETDKLKTIGFVDLHELRNSENYDRLETWSKMVLEHLLSFKK